MDPDSRLARALDHLAETALVGLLAVLGALPVLTAWTSLAAATAILADRGAGGSPVRRYRDAFAARWRSGVLLNLVAGAAGCVALVDVTWATSAPLDPLRTLVLAAGCTLGLAAASVAVAALAAPPTRSVGQLLRWAAPRAAARPLRSLNVGVVAVLLSAPVAVVPVLLPIAAGLTARTAARVLTPMRHRDPRRRTLPFRPVPEVTS